MARIAVIAEVVFSVLCSLLITAWYTGLYHPGSELARHMIFVGGALMPLVYLYRLHRQKRPN